MQPSKYHFELWDASGNLLADLSGRAKNRSITQSRNEAEDISWQVSLPEFERLARSMNKDPSTLLIPGSTEVRIRRGQKYLCGGKVTYRNIAISDASQDIEIRASGFLNLFLDRYTAEQRVFTATEATTIISTVINESQSVDASSSFGITIGSLATVGAHDKTYKAQQLKSVLQDATNLWNFDFEFTPDKIFNTYAALGSRRPEIIFEYPGNIIEIQSPLDATNIKNRVYVLGSGSGSGDGANAKVQVDDINSQLNYQVREERINYSDVEDTTALTAHGSAEIAAWSFPFEIPQITVDGNQAPYITDYGIGDYVTVKFSGYRMLQQINALFRVEKRTIQIDDEDKETVKLYLSR